MDIGEKVSKMVHKKNNMIFHINYNAILNIEMPSTCDSDFKGVLEFFLELILPLAEGK